MAPVVRRIFDDYLEGNGDRAIAAGLNRDGVPCPSRRRPDQNKHRLADGWQGSTVRAILENPRYTGYAVFGRWTKHEVLADPDDVAAGHVTRFKRSSPDRIVRSRKPAHPAIVSVEDFTQVQLLRKSRSAGSMRGIAKLERKRTTTKHTYLLRGHVRCEICTRKMQGGVVRSSVCSRFGDRDQLGCRTWMRSRSRLARPCIWRLSTFAVDVAFGAGVVVQGQSGGDGVEVAFEAGENERSSLIAV